jgi:hypothetical protein
LKRINQISPFADQFTTVHVTDCVVIVRLERVNVLVPSTRIAELAESSPVTSSFNVPIKNQGKQEEWQNEP